MSNVSIVEVDAGKIFGAVATAGFVVGGFAIGLGVVFGQKRAEGTASETKTATAPVPPPVSDNATDGSVTGSGPTPKVPYVRIGWQHILPR